MSANNTITVTFTHPRSEKTYPAELSRDITAAEVIEHLKSAECKGFLASGPQYLLVPKRSKVSLAPTDTFEKAGIESGDIVEVQVTEVAGENG